MTVIKEVLHALMHSPRDDVDSANTRKTQATPTVSRLALNIEVNTI